MDRALWNAIQELLDAADFALGPLDRYSDFEDDPLGPTMVPNAALTAHSCLESAIAGVEKLMPPDPESDLEKAIARAEYEEDR
jgi:hypothetical protein